MSDLPVGSSTIAREEEEVMEELQLLLAPDVQDIDIMLYEDFDMPSELDDDPERVCQNAEREGSRPRTANDDAEAGLSTSAAAEGADRSGTNAIPQAREPWHVIAELKQLMADLQKQLDDRPIQVPTASLPQVRVSPKDIALVKFSGNDNMGAHFMSPEKYLPLLEWLHSAEFTLRTSRLDATHHVSVLLQHLAGAAKRMFLKKYGHRLHELCGNIRRIIPYVLTMIGGIQSFGLRVESGRTR
jgi:hypothetical protein